MNDTTVALTLVLAVLVIAAVASRWLAVAASLVAFACYNFFFLPPVGTFAIANRDDLIALFALLAVSLIGSHLSYVARQREIARRSAETKSALVASLSHDLKTPLTALTVATANLSAGGLSDEERREQIEIVNSELDRLRRLFNNIVDLASVDSRAVNAQREWVQPAEIVHAASRQAEGVLSSRPLDVTGGSDQWLVQLDPRLLTAALGHVLENAATYSPAASPIHVDVRVADSQLVIAVRDHGPGLPPAELEKVFERFYRGSAAPRDRFGSGLGLAIARGLLAIQHGRITAANHTGGGAIFTLEIPTAARPADDVALDVA